LDRKRQVDVRSQLDAILSRIVEEEGLTLSRPDRIRIMERITDEAIGWGPLQTPLDEEAVSEIMIYGPQRTDVRRDGKVERANVFFQNEEHILRTIDRILAPVSRQSDMGSAERDASRLDGVRISVTTPTTADGPMLVIRKQLEDDASGRSHFPWRVTAARDSLGKRRDARGIHADRALGVGGGPPPPDLPPPPSD
jgi:pilus assembly protein CpaF